MDEDKKKKSVCGFIKSLLHGEYDVLIKRIWYVFILIIGCSYIWISRYEIYNFSEVNTAHIISIIGLIIIIAPIFSEVELFGFKFKKEIEKIEEQVKEVKTGIMTMQMQTQTTTHLYTYNYPSLPNEDKENLEHKIVDRYPKKDVSTDFKIDDDTIFLFSVRRQLEQILNKIALDFDAVNHRNIEQRAYVNSPTLLRNMYQHELIEKDIYSALREIFATCNKAVHGHDVSSAEIDFVRKTVPSCLALLKNIRDSL